MKILLAHFCEFLKYKRLILLLFLTYSSFAQNSFTLQTKKKSSKIRFEIANNLIIVPVVLNGVELSFILDTGVGSTIIFSVDNKESLELRNTTKIYLRGLGDDEPVEAIKSLKNELRIGDATSLNHTVYLVFDESINFSPRMGFPIHGIIGYDFFKDFVMDINYIKKVIKVHDARGYVYKNCKKCYQTHLDFTNNSKRPLVNAKYRTDLGLIDIRLLLDSGSGSSLWLFENKKKHIKIPENSFTDFLGKGFNGDIYGKRSKIKELHLGDFLLKEVTTSFPDSVYIQGISLDKREGSLGGNVLRRFNLIVDYPNQKISFKKNTFFNKPFHYNMSGLTIQHVGFNTQFNQIQKKSNTNHSNNWNDIVEKERIYLGLNQVVNEKTLELANSFVLRPIYEISDVRKDSPAALAGLQKGDLILEVNGRKAYQYKLSQLNDLFYFEEGKRIKMKVKRLGVDLLITFYLKKVI